MRYINTESIVRNEVRSIFSKASRTVDRSYNAILHEGNPIFCQSVEFSLEDSFWYAWVIIQVWSAPEYIQAEDAIEKALRSLKTDNGHIFLMRNHRESTIRVLSLSFFPS